MNLQIEFETEEIDITEKAERTAGCCYAAEGVTVPVYAAVTFVDDEAIHEINLEQRGVDKATDVLSFPSVNYPEGMTAGQCEKLLKREYDPSLKACFLGDIIVSIPHARAQAAEYGHSTEREICYLIAHGLFHLMGYDHMTDEDKEKMRPMEDKALNMAGMNRVTDEELIKMAYEAMQFSYSPYSHFKVGAALLAKNGTVFKGCNIENASYGVTNCAERTALFKAVSESVKEFTAIAVVAEKGLAWPCGICRQALNEFAPDIRVITEWDGQIMVKSLPELLPESFGAGGALVGFLGSD